MPESRNNATEAFRQVGDDELTPRPTVVANVTRMRETALAVSAVLIFSSMLASFSIPLMMGRGGGGQMLMIDVYYRCGQHGDFETAAALGVVGYVLAMGAALVYLRNLTR